MIGYVTCVKANENHLFISLQYGKLYKVVTPLSSDPDFMIRIVDDTGDDYLYLREWFRDG